MGKCIGKAVWGPGSWVACFAGGLLAERTSALYWSQQSFAYTIARDTNEFFCRRRQCIQCWPVPEYSVSRGTRVLHRLAKSPVERKMDSGSLWHHQNVYGLKQVAMRLITQSLCLVLEVTCLLLPEVKWLFWYRAYNISTYCHSRTMSWHLYSYCGCANQSEPSLFVIGL